MHKRNKTPKDMATAVCARMNRLNIQCPPISVLINLFQTLYYASLRTEEGRSINCHIVYLDPKNPDPDPPKRIVKDRWSYIPFTKSVMFTVSTLVKAASASDPRSSSFVVYPDSSGVLQIWGLIDQGTRYHDFVNYDSDSGPDRPGLLEVSIRGVGHIIACIDYTIIAELRINELVKGAIDVFRAGPIRAKLLPGAKQSIRMIRREVSGSVFRARDHWSETLEDHWFDSIRRLLGRMRGHRHGGALLITSMPLPSELNVKYGLIYPRLYHALERWGVYTISETFFNDSIFQGYYDPCLDNMPVQLHRSKAVAQFKLEETESELDACLWFISLLSRVDGLVMLTHELEVKGFGVEIMSTDEPDAVYIASDPYARNSRLRQFDYKHFGTRHRSMMRYCMHDESAVGFVVSQDGDVRVITKLIDKIVLWDNIKLDILSDMQSSDVLISSRRFDTCGSSASV